MSSIAQQDYIRLQHKIDLAGRYLLGNAESILFIRQKRATPETLLSVIFEYDGDVYPIVCVSEGVVIAQCGLSARPLPLTDYGDSDNIYDALAKIQDALDEPERTPRLRASGGHLRDTYQGVTTWICVDGKMLAPTFTTQLGNDVLTAIELTEDTPEEGATYINISWEDAQNLIGYIQRE